MVVRPLVSFPKLCNGFRLNQVLAFYPNSCRANLILVHLFEEELILGAEKCA
jgi:hypothetical protein